MTGFGNLGGNAFACAESQSYSGYYGWHLFNDDTTLWATNVGHAGYIIFYNPDALKVSSITNRNYQAAYISTSGYVYGSHNGSNWTQLCSYTNNVTSSKSTWRINVNSRAFYKYHKVTYNAGSGTYVQNEYMAINATYIDKEYLYDLSNLYISNNEVRRYIKY